MTLSDRSKTGAGAEGDLLAITDANAHAFVPSSRTTSCTVTLVGCLGWVPASPAAFSCPCGVRSKDWRWRNATSKITKPPPSVVLFQDLSYSHYGCHWWFDFTAVGQEMPPGIKPTICNQNREIHALLQPTLSFCTSC